MSNSVVCAFAQQVPQQLLFVIPISLTLSRLFKIIIPHFFGTNSKFSLYDQQKRHCNLITSKWNLFTKQTLCLKSKLKDWTTKSRSRWVLFSFWTSIISLNCFVIYWILWKGIEIKQCELKGTEGNSLFGGTANNQKGLGTSDLIFNNRCLLHASNRLSDTWREVKSTIQSCIKQK